MTLMDRREIEFDAKTVMRAIGMSSKAAQGFGLPAIPPIEVRFRPADGKVDVLYGTAQSPRAVPLDAVSLGALLVSYCIRARIPMPRKSDKGIRIEARCAILAFRTTLADAPPTVIAEAAADVSGHVAAWAWIEPANVPRK